MEWEQVYATHRAAVYHTALSFLKNAATAEDVMQDVFLSYYNTLQEGKPVRHLRAWLLTATRHRCLNVLRDSKPEELTDDVTELVAPVADLSERVALREALAVLTAEEHLAFSLHYLDGYKYREIAAGLDWPVGTVQTRCRTARRKLQAALRVDPLLEEQEETV
ncbi:MAG: sigma-70 family RNA polymerase sigma factor [Clostridia bacterium]|nr:sigma-70 family RNA polymerase sigma factor [Clostridia bacterium]